MERAVEEYLQERNSSTEVCLSDDMLRKLLKEFDTTIKEEIEEEVKLSTVSRSSKWNMKGNSVGYRYIDHTWMFEVKNARFIKEPDQVQSAKCKVCVLTATEADRKRKP